MQFPQDLRVIISAKCTEKLFRKILVHRLQGRKPQHFDVSKFLYATDPDILEIIDVQSEFRFRSWRMQAHPLMPDARCLPGFKKTEVPPNLDEVQCASMKPK